MNELKLFINYSTIETPTGGSNSFIKALHKELSGRLDVVLKNRVHDVYDICLINSGVMAPGKYVCIKQVAGMSGQRLPRFLKKIFPKAFVKKIVVQRLDGIRSMYANVGENRLDQTQKKIYSYAQGVIFQSQYSKDMFLKAGYSEKFHRVIMNGVDQSMFSFRKRTSDSLGGIIKVVASSWSDNPSKGHQIIADASLLDNIEVHYAGRWPKSINPEKVILYEAKRQDELGAFYQDKDLYLFPSQNESCPNTVIEALSCGLPVLYHNSGGTSEIVKGCYGRELSCSLEDDFKQILIKYDEYVAAIERDLYFFSIKRATDDYMEFMRSLLQNS